MNCFLNAVKITNTDTGSNTPIIESTILLKNYTS